MAAPRGGRGRVPGLGRADADGRPAAHLRHLRPDVHHGGEKLFPVPRRLLLPPGRLRAQLLRPLSQLPVFQRPGMGF